MKKIKGYVIEKYTNMSNSYTCKRLKEEAVKRNVDLEIIGVNDIYYIDGNIYHGNVKLEKRDFVINRFPSGKIKDKFNLLAQRQYNRLEYFNIFINKFNQLDRFNFKSDIKKPKTILATTSMDFDILKNLLNIPFIAKGLESSEGKEIFLIENKDDYIELSKYGNESKEFVFQEFISTSFGRDIRLYSIKGNIVASMIRESDVDFRANIALGGKGTKFEVDENIKNIAKEIYEQSKLDFLGIDLLFGEKEPYYCEINIKAGIKGMETATGINVAGKIIDEIVRDINE